MIEEPAIGEFRVVTATALEDSTVAQVVQRARIKITEHLGEIGQINPSVIVHQEVPVPFRVLVPESHDGWKVLETIERPTTLHILGEIWSQGPQRPARRWCGRRCVWQQQVKDIQYWW